METGVIDKRDIRRIEYSQSTYCYRNLGLVLLVKSLFLQHEYIKFWEGTAGMETKYLKLRDRPVVHSILSDIYCDTMR